MSQLKKTEHAFWGPLSTLVLTIGIFFGGQLLGGTILYMLFGLIGWKTVDVASWLTDATIGQFTFMLSVQAVTFGLLYWCVRSNKSSLGTIGLVRPKLRDGGYALLGAAIYFPASILVASIVSKLIPSINLDQQQQIGFQKATSAPELFIVFITLVVLPPLVEELLFRGFLLTGLRTKLPLMYAAVITSLIFASPHLQVGEAKPLLWAAFIDTFVLSMVLVLIRVKGKSLWSSIGLHAIKNGVAFTALFILKLS